MEKKIYLSRWGDDITNEIKEVAEQMQVNPNITIEFDVDFSACYYEGDEPSYRLLVKGLKDE